MPSVRGRERGRFPLRAAAYQPARRRRRPPAQPLAQTISVGLVAETEAALAAAAALAPVTDDFERADATLASPWANWLTPLPVISSGSVVPPVGNYGDATYSIAINADAYCEAIFDALVSPAGGARDFGVGIRLTAHSGSADGYAFELLDIGTGLQGRLYKGAAFTTLATGASTAYSNVEGIRISALGTTIRGYVRLAGVWTLVVSATDGTYTAAGYPGFWTHKSLGTTIGIESVTWGDASATAQTVTAGLVAETETAQTVRSVKTTAVGLIAETETSQASTRRKTKTLGLTTETETPQTVALRQVKTVAVGQVVDTQTAQPITRTLPSGPGASTVSPGSRGRERGRFPLRGKPWAAPVRARGLGTWAQGPRTAQVIAVGQVVDTQLAQSLVNTPQTHAVGLATETETAQRILTARIVASGFPYPIPHIIAGPFVLVTRITETELAQAVAKSKVKALGRPADTEFALSIAAVGSKVITVGIAAETELAQTVVRTRPIGQATETETAQAATHRKTRAVGQATETDTPQTVRAAHSHVIGPVVETQTALPATRVKSRTVGEPLEFSTAQSHRHQKLKTLGQALEQDAALASNAKLIAVGLVSETELAQAATHRKTTATGQAAETEAAQAILAARVKAIGQATETEAALEIRGVGIVLVGIAEETSASFAIAGHSKTIHVRLATDTQTALALIYTAPKFVAISRPVTQERALPLRTTTGPVTFDPVPGGYITAARRGHVEREGVLVS